MKLILPIVAAMATLVPAQVSQLSSCVAFNDGPTAAPTAINLCNTTATVSFVAQATFTVTEVEIYASAAQGICSSVSSSGGGSSGVACTMTGSLSGTRWWTINVQPLTVSAGSTCTVAFSPVITTFGGANALTAHSNPTGTAPLLITRQCSVAAACLFTYPCQLPPAMETLMFRLRGPACTGGVPGVYAYVGSGCGTAVPTLTPSGFPVVGNPSFTLNLQGASSVGLPAYLFLAEGWATSGAPVEPGSPCLTHLLPASFDYLNALGYEPIAIATILSSGIAPFPLGIPPLPVLIGIHVTFQAAIVGPGGVPMSTVPGLALTLSSALALQVGS